MADVAFWQTPISTGDKASSRSPGCSTMNQNSRDMTLYYFGDTEPAHYGVSGFSYVINAVDDQSRLAGLDSVKTRYLAVSASLQWGPWGPPGFFRILDHIEPLRFTDDTTIAIYRTADLQSIASSVQVVARAIADLRDRQPLQQPSEPASQRRST